MPIRKTSVYVNSFDIYLQNIVSFFSALRFLQIRNSNEQTKLNNKGMIHGSIKTFI